MNTYTGNIALTPNAQVDILVTFAYSYTNRILICVGSTSNNLYSCSSPIGDWLKTGFTIRLMNRTNVSNQNSNVFYISIGY